MPIDKIDVCAEMRKKFDLHDLDPASLENSDVISMQNHVGACEPCKSWLATCEIVSISAKHIADRPVPADLAERVMAKVDAEPVTVSPYREIIFSIACFAAVLVFLATFGSETISEILAWCVSFVILILAQRVFSAMRPQAMV
jgi:hypothetical protein